MCLGSQAGLCGSWPDHILLQFQLPEEPPRRAILLLPRAAPDCSAHGKPSQSVVEGAAAGLGGEKPEPAGAHRHSGGFCSCRHRRAGLLEAARTLAMNSGQSIPLCMTPATAGDTQGGWMRLAEVCSRDSLLKKEDFASRRPLPPPGLHCCSFGSCCANTFSFYGFLNQWAVWRKLYFPGQGELSALA